MEQQGISLSIAILLSAVILAAILVIGTIVTAVLSAAA